MNNNLLMAVLAITVASVLTIGVNMPVYAQSNSTTNNSTTGNTTGVETNPDSSLAPGMEVNGTTLVSNGTNATTTTPANTNATIG
jgi:hypothetical protein